MCASQSKRGSPLTRPPKIAIGALLGLALASTAGRAAADAFHAPHVFNGRYIAQWGGLHTADFTLSLDHNARSYLADFELRTRSIFNWLTGLDLKAGASGAPDQTADPGSLLAPKRFQVLSRSKWRSMQTVVEFEDGLAEASIQTLATYAAISNEHAQDDEPLDAEYRINVVDPLSALVEAIAHVRRHLAEGGDKTVAIPVFDGRRRFDALVTYQGPAERTLGGRKRAVHIARVQIKPVAGFRAKKLDFWKDVAFEAVLSQNKLRPLQISSLGAGPVLNLVEECAQACPIAETGKGS
ncbi:MAG: DUF3108 domain-containing protein [Proteobacteria bacterium]|nr:DUF3108 domain-containing protein [Pseudomonadota bacterium]